jgi:replicative DNA helicase
MMIDYLGLIKPDGKTQDLYHKITAISGELKRLAREENILIICLAQLNRDTAKTKSKPEMKDLRDSGAIEQDADAIIFVHRENYHGGEKILQENGSKSKNFASSLDQSLDQNTYLCIRKNRHGVEQRIDIPFAYIPEYGKMVPVLLENSND